MEKSKVRHQFLSAELSQLLSLETNLETMLTVSMYKLNQSMDSERLSIFLIDRFKQQLTSFSSLDLAKQEIQMSLSSGVAGWVFVNREAAIINDAYKDDRFYRGVDDMTGFRTRNLICTPLIDDKRNCWGTLQSLNKNRGDFTLEDLDLLSMTARLLAGTIYKNRCCDNVLMKNIKYRKLASRLSKRLAMAQ